MSERSQSFMSAVWKERNNDADTEEKLISAVLRLAAENVRSYSAQDGRIVLDKNDLLELSEELKNDSN